LPDREVGAGLHAVRLAGITLELEMNGAIRLPGRCWAGLFRDDASGKRAVEALGVGALASLPSAQGEMPLNLTWTALSCGILPSAPCRHGPIQRLDELTAPPVPRHLLRDTARSRAILIP
jgi:hypothetical protein